MMDSFDISELPEHITQYRNRVLTEALERNAPYLQKMMENLHPRQARVMWQQIAQMAVNALSNYMEPRVDSLSQGDDPRVVFYDSDQSEPVRSYVNAWVEGYATRALGGRCSEHEVRPSIEQSGISLYPIDNRVNYAEAILPQNGYSRECVSVAIGHAILSYAISLSDEVSDEEKARFSWKGDIDGFASGWRYAQSHGLGYDGEYVPYSDEDQIDRFMQSLSDSAADASGQDAGDTRNATPAFKGNAGDETGVTENGNENDAIRNISEVETSLPDRYATVFDQTGQIQTDASGTTGIYIEVSDERDGIASSASDSEVFTSDDFEDVTEEEILHIKTKTSESSESLTGQQVAIVSESEAEASEEDVTERTVRRLPPMFEKYLFLTISSAIRGNAARIAQLTDAGMTFEQSEHLKRKVMSATARYGLKELALMDLKDGIPAGEDGTEPVRTYANSWLQGYISVITDGEFSQAAIIRSALMSIVTPDSIEQDVEHVLERQQWEGYDDECSMVAIAHLRVSLSPHGEGHPLAHAMEGTGRFSHRGATDGFSDGWWKATEIVRRLEEETRQDATEAEPEPEETREEQTDDSMDKAKEEAKMLLAGLFTEDDILPEESVASLIGPPMPVPVTRERPHAKPQQEGNGDESDEPRQDGTGVAAEPRNDAESPSQQAGRPGHDDGQASRHGADAMGAAAQPQERKPPTQQERVRKHAEACMTQAVRQRSDLVKRMWTNTGTTRDAAKVWTNAVQQATAAYGWHIINDLGANPAKSKDGTRPMLSYASAWISGYVAGFSGDEPTERTIQGISQTLGISLGETGERSSYAQNVCSMKGYGAECLASLLRHMKYEFLMHDGHNPESVGRADAKTYNWIADIDGYADGWFVARRVRLQQQRQSQSR